MDLKRFSEFAKSVRVTDGAWGTELQKLGLPPGTCSELWNIENPEAIEKVARSYVDASSEVILTNTFGGNKFVLGKYGVAKRTTELVEAGAAISRKAAGSNAKVFGSIGPSGKIVMIEPTIENELFEAFSEAARALHSGGADAIVLETFNELDEAIIALKAAVSTSLPVVISMTFSSGPDGTSTMMGNSPADLVKAAKEHKAAAVGANCGAGPDNYVKVASLLRAATNLPIWIKPNTGLPVVKQGKTVFPMNPVEFAAFGPKLADAGANFIGGCCGTTPEHIRMLKKAVGE